jgi:hypothetical protein
LKSPAVSADAADDFNLPISQRGAAASLAFLLPQGMTI